MTLTRPAAGGGGSPAVAVPAPRMWVFVPRVGEGSVLRESSVVHTCASGVRPSQRYVLLVQFGAHHHGALAILGTGCRPHTIGLGHHCTG